MDVREKLVELLDNFNCDLSEYAGNPKFFVVDDNIKLADHLIANGVTVQEWISVKDRLPEESGKHLVFGRTFGNKKPQIWICECISIGRVMGWCNSAKNPVVTHWMPLPEPPKEVDNG